MILLYASVTVVLSAVLMLLPGFVSYVLRCYNRMYRAMPMLRIPLVSLSNNKPPSGLPALEPVEEVSSVVCRVLGMNPGAYTLQGTNTYLVGSGVRRALIDTGEQRTAHAYIPLLMQVMRSRGVRGLSHIVITHHHGDHVGGVGPLLSELAKHEDMLPLPTVYQCVTASSPKPSYSYQQVQDGDVLRVDGAELRVHFTPGHTEDHISLLFTATDSSTATGLFTGDCILGCGSAVFDDLHSYMASLAKIQHLVAAAAGDSSALQLYPGHGPVISADESIVKVQEYISHRQMREQQLVTALSAAPLSSWELMKAVYPPLPLLVQMSAQWNVLHHLEKLKKENKVHERWPDVWSIKDM